MFSKHLLLLFSYVKIFPLFTIKCNNWMNSDQKSQGEVKSLTIFTKKRYTPVRDPLYWDLNVPYFGHPNMFVNFFNPAQDVIESVFVCIIKNINLINFYTIFLLFRSIWQLAKKKLYLVIIQNDTKWNMKMLQTIYIMYFQRQEEKNIIYIWSWQNIGVHF